MHGMARHGTAQQGKVRQGRAERTRHAELARSHGATRCFMPRARDPYDPKTEHYFPLPTGFLSLSLYRSLSPSPGIFSGCCRTLVVLQNEAQARHERPEINIISRVACAAPRRGYANREFLRISPPCRVYRQSRLPFGRNLFVASGVCLVYDRT